MNYIANILELLGAALGSLFYLLAVLLAVTMARRRISSAGGRVLAVAGFTLAYILAYAAARRLPALAQWLYPLESPLILAAVLMALPALFLPRNRAYALFLLIPLGVLMTAVARVAWTAASRPAGAGFAWFVLSPAWLLAGVAAFLVWMQYFLKVDAFRRLTRWTCFVVLMYGGFAFRASVMDYQQMLARRPAATPGIANLSETTPVLQDARRLAYLPSAPCRFSADGGYVQGCVLELSQRLMQINFTKVHAGDPGETALLSMALAALLMLSALCVIGARWWCGWVCPLSALGDGIDWIRRRLRQQHLKPSQPVKLAYLVSGLSLASFGLLLARAYPSLDAQGKFLGCKIPLYPFCKLCPGQQVCPVAALGPAGYPPLPGWDWLFGVFRVGALAMLALFVVSYAAGRRLWCRFCPMGMVGGLFNRGGLLALKKNVGRCNGCGVCHEVCPMDIPSVAAERRQENVSCFDCVYCLKCVTHCPQNGCLRLEFAGTPVVESRFGGTA